MANYEQVWDLDVIFKGGSDSERFHSYVSSLEEGLTELSSIVSTYVNSNKDNNHDSLMTIINFLEKISKKLRESGAFVSCLSAQDINDKQAGLLRGKINQLRAQYSTILTTLDQKLSAIDKKQWDSLLERPDFQELTFVLNERRENAKEKLPLDQEALINDLGIDGYHAWGQMYDAIVGKIEIPFEENGEVKLLSVGQAANKMSHPSRDVRKDVFKKVQNAWQDNEDLFGETLNHLAGFRLQTYKHRGWDSALKEPLSINRMSEQTLNTMWQVISDNKSPLVSYLNRKAEMLGIDKMSWYDIGAPVGSAEQKVSYDEGAAFIIEQFQRFGPKMADFTKMAFEKSWIEAEDRPGKRPGGFCTSFPDSGQTRIFMTYSGTASNVSTLAHELGHAFHQHVMDDLHAMNQGYAMNVAETASTFAEMIVADAAVKNAKSEEERLVLLEDKVQRSVALLMNIHSRFLFETKFYKERKEGVVPVERLNEMMEEAQKEAFCGALEEYEPSFWASKLHFHITGVPFYNFPYTFGYLFSLGIYAKALEEGSDFEEKYIALLKDTGRMKVEDLAEKHLGVNLEEPEFWEKAVGICMKDVEEFLELTK